MILLGVSEPRDPRCSYGHMCQMRTGELELPRRSACIRRIPRLDRLSGSRLTPSVALTPSCLNSRDCHSRDRDALLALLPTFTFRAGSARNVLPVLVVAGLTE